MVNTPDSPLNSVTHCAERIGISYLVFTSMKMSIKDWFLKNSTKFHSVLLSSLVRFFMNQSLAECHSVNTNQQKYAKIGIE